jgi:hypothetical protein
MRLLGSHGPATAGVAIVAAKSAAGISLDVILCPFPKRWRFQMRHWSAAKVSYRAETFPGRTESFGLAN